MRHVSQASHDIYLASACLILTNDRHASYCGGMTEHAEVAAEPPVTLGWRIRIALDHGGLEQTDLMGKFEVSRGTVSRWCRDVGPAPKKFILNEIAVMCGVSPRWLIDGKTANPPDGDGGVSSHLGESNSRPIHYLRTRTTRTAQLSDPLGWTG